MTYPKWKYRKHPTLGCFQRTLVETAEAEATLDADWSDDPASTGFAVRPATQLSSAHITEGGLYELVPDSADDSGAPVLSASIEMTTTGDNNG